MKKGGQIRQVRHPVTGELRWSKYPSTVEAAVLEGVSKFWPQTPCPIHGGEPVIYSKTLTPGCCAIRNAVDEYNKALQAGEPISPSDAAAGGFDYYWGPQEHQKCGHPGKHTLNGNCYFCRHDKTKSPRQEALDKNAPWYLPTTRCGNGHLARRRVSNGSCEECEKARQEKAAATNGETISKQIMQQYPDMILTRADAISGGFLYYRSGGICRFGHTGWRYTSTGACMDCKAENDEMARRAKIA